MVGYLKNPARRIQLVGLSIVALCGTIAAFATVMLEGTKTGAVLSAALTVGPALLYAAITVPVAFPFSLYAVVTPFDRILDMPAFGTLTKVIGIAAGAAFLFYMLRTKRFNDPPRSVVPWVLLFLWMLSSMFWAADVTLSQRLLPTSLELLGLYIVASMMPMSMKQLRVACASVAAGGIIAASYGLHLYRSGVAEYKDRLWLHTDSSSWNPDHFAASLLAPLSICLVAVFWSRKTSVRVVAGLGMAIMLLTMVYTGARGAALGFLGLFIYLIIRDKHRWKMALWGGALAAVAVIVEGQKYLARWQDASQSGGSGRVAIWTVGWHAFQQNWLYGAGYANFPFAYDKAFINVFESFYGQWHRASHNILLGYGVELGVIGVALLLIGWWGQFRMLRFIGEDDPRWPFRLAFEGALIALFISGMFADIMTEKYVWLAFMLVAFTYNAAPARVTEPIAAQIRAPAHA